MNTETKTAPCGCVRRMVNRVDLRVGDYLVARDGYHKIVDVEQKPGPVTGSMTHVTLEIRGRQFRQPVYGTRVVWRKEQE